MFRYFSGSRWRARSGARCLTKKIDKCTPGCIEASEKTKKTRSSYQLAGDDSLTFFTLLGKRVSAVQGVALPFQVSC